MLGSGIYIIHLGIIMKNVEILLILILTVMIYGGYRVIYEINKIGYQACWVELMKDVNSDICSLDEFKPYAK